VRAIGPELTQYGVLNALADPTRADTFNRRKDGYLIFTETAIKSLQPSGRFVRLGPQ
jgi:hypothetical protein